MQDFEKLGSFYLGRPYDLERREPKPGLLLYDSKDLVTHAVCIGMTGSGKTGLCLSLLEEAAIDGIPAILIDPKGDLGNLLLTFPDLKAEDFAPWVEEAEAQKKGLSLEAYAEAQAVLWKKGLGDWGQAGERIRRLRDATEFAIYTPGSTAGLPVAILRSFAAPAGVVREDRDLLRERVSTTATSLLALLGIEADPIRSREHILVSTVLDTAWRQGHDLDLQGLIQRIQAPPVARIGVLDLESFYPSKERFTLAMSLNNLLAAPSFDAWLSGEPLDIGRMLWTTAGRPRVAIFSIAHLSDAERMFFVALLLNEILGWMRTQSGTTSLRAVLYMDEIFGYFPPVANPPSKPPLLTLLKQGRAFGLGIVLATQNPVDLDYKGLGNTGTWFIGRLQTERDKARVLEGLEGVAAGTGTRFDRQSMTETLAGLGNRIFLLNNVHDDAPEVFETRWAMSYLRGPLTRAQIKRLMDPQKAAQPAPTTTGPATPAAAEPTAAMPVAGGPSGPRPILPPGVPQYFLPVRGARPAGGGLRYEPMVLGAGTVRFADAKAGLDATQDAVFLTPITDEAVPVSWEAAAEAAVDVTDLEKTPAEDADYAALPDVAGKAKSYETFRRDFAKWLYATMRLELLKSPGYKAFSTPGETERDFRIRLSQAAREQRDQWVAALRQRYAPKTAALEERLRRAQQAEAREKEQVTQQGLQAAISVGATILGAVLGRKAVSASTLGRATTAVRGAGRVLKERQDVGRAADTVGSLKQQLEDLETEVQAEMRALDARTDPLTEPLETVSLTPKKTNISVKLVALVWAPHWQPAQGPPTPAWS
ncbi:MAG: ATP-binding protein [Candidatus Rokuibacteriota bacterium]